MVFFRIFSRVCTVILGTKLGCATIVRHHPLNAAFWSWFDQQAHWFTNLALSSMHLYRTWFLPCIQNGLSVTLYKQAPLSQENNSHLQTRVKPLVWGQENEVKYIPSIFQQNGLVSCPKGCLSQVARDVSCFPHSNFAWENLSDHWTHPWDTGHQRSWSVFIWFFSNSNIVHSHSSDLGDTGLVTFNFFYFAQCVCQMFMPVGLICQRFHRTQLFCRHTSG